MAERICFLGRGGVGKSVIVSNISASLAKMGYGVLQIGNDISLNSTMLLRDDENITPVLEEFRNKYHIQVEDYLVKGSSGVYCLELGSIEPGVGCLARGINLVDEMMEQQGMLEKYHINYVLYDIVGDIPCTGYILPIREGIMSQCIIITDGNYSALCTTNSILAGVVRIDKENQKLVRLLINQADKYPTKSLITSYAEATNLTILGYLNHYMQIEISTLSEKTVIEDCPDCIAAKEFEKLSHSVIHICKPKCPKPFDRDELLKWQKKWKLDQLEQKSGIIQPGNI
ncbi:nucleotide-binding protein [Anaerocolumna sedimenticola]|nr:hypothetical protein [Anaerocolumna sedimenticola]